MANRLSWNCDGDTNKALYFPWAPELRICPNAYITDDIWAMLRWWMDWKQFESLPYPGGHDLLDQPAFVVDVIRKCEDTCRAIDASNEAAAKQRQEAMREQAKREALARRLGRR